VQQPPPPSARDRALRWTIGVGVGVLFTWLATRAWPLDKLFAGQFVVVAGDGWPTVAMRGAEGETIWSLSLLHLLGYALVLTAIHAWRVLRWLPLVRPFAPVPLRVLNRIGAVGFMGVFLLPLRLGELVRPALLARDGRVPFGTGLTMIAVERVSDGLMVSLMLFAVLMTVPESALERAPAVGHAAHIAIAIFGAAMCALIATALARRQTTALVQATLGRLSGALASKILTLLTTFIDGLRVLGSPAAVAQFVLLTAGYWLTNGFGIWLMARAFGLELPVTAGYTMMCCVVVGMMIPNSPGNVGSFWYFLLMPTELYGVDAASPAAVAFALAVWLMQLIQISVFGAAGAWGRSRAATAQAEASDMRTARPR
jgi:uncharacterized protein (TIRG00374 family)